MTVLSEEKLAAVTQRIHEAIVAKFAQHVPGKTLDIPYESAVRTVDAYLQITHGAKSEKAWRERQDRLDALHTRVENGIEYKNLPFSIRKYVESTIISPLIAALGPDPETEALTPDPQSAFGSDRRGGHRSVKSTRGMGG